MIWIDITNHPHVLFFKNFIKNNKTFVTARDHGKITQFLVDKKIYFNLVGKHGGQDKKNKLAQSAMRVLELTETISEQQIDVCMSKQSVELPRVAFGLQLPCIQIVDNEHAIHQNRLTLPLCSRVLVPSALDTRKLRQQGANKDQILTFNGLCELVHIEDFVPSERIIKEQYILLRPEPYLASYFKGVESTQKVIDSLSSKFKVLILPRENLNYDNASIPNTRDSLNLIFHASAFIGGGGTMNRESALLGTPTLSYYPQDILGVDKFLIKKKLMVHATNIKEISSHIDEIIERKDKIRLDAIKLQKTLENPMDVLDHEINNLMDLS